MHRLAEVRGVDARLGPARQSGCAAKPAVPISDFGHSTTMRLKAREGEEGEGMHTMNMALLSRAPSACAQPFDVEKDDLREALGDIGRRLYRSRTLREAETALDEVKLLLGVPWAVWNADTAPPSSCPEAVAYCERSGWPPEIRELWKDRHVPLKTQFYIRCRFEHLPFVTVFDRKPKRRISSKYSQIDELLRIMGISTMLTVRFHLHNVVRKFGCKNRTQAIALAAQLGVLGPIGP